MLKGPHRGWTSHNVIAPRCWAPKRPGGDHLLWRPLRFRGLLKGVYDNGAGSVINMEVLRYFKESRPKRTLDLMWYGSEEIGLEGAAGPM